MCMANKHKFDHFAKNYPNERWHQWLKRRILPRWYIFLFYSWIIKNSKNVDMKHRTSGELRLSLALQIEWVKGSETTVIDVDSETKEKWLSSIYP